MQDKDLLQQLLKLEKPWVVSSFEIDAPSNRLDIYIGAKQKKSFLGLKKNKQSSDNNVYRHLTVWNMRTYIHVPTNDAVTVDKIWAPAGSNCTIEMENHVINILENSSSKQAAASISGLSLAEIRAISDRTGAGNKEPEQHAAQSQNNTGITIETVSGYNSEKSFVIDSDEIPAKTDDCWRQLIDGHLQLGKSPVALQMLMQKIRQQLSNHYSETNMIKAADVLRQYFVKNKSLHQHEIEALRNSSTDSIKAKVIDTETVPGIPAVQASVWQQVIQGNIQINTSDIALQMMIERVRQTTERNSSEAGMLAAIKILRQFFLKHLARLGSEVEQLCQYAGTTRHLTHEVKAATIPGEDDKCWQQLIDGQLTIRTNTVGLQMMIERIRRAISRNNTATNRMAATKMLRQYFIKHQASARNELAQLTTKTKQRTASVTDLNVPPVAHPSWQRIINGEVQISTDAVALKMMLQSIRLSVENNPGEAARAAAAKILRQYFLKHQSSHRTEIEQLIAA